MTSFTSHPTGSSKWSSLFDCIQHIVYIGTDKDVIGIDTRRIVAVMAGQHPGWEWLAVSKFPCYLMRGSYSSVDENPAVVSTAFRAIPDPALAGLINLRPKLFGSHEKASRALD